MLFSENIKITKKGFVFTDKNGNFLNIRQAINKALIRFLNWYLDFELMLIHAISEHVVFAGIRKFIFRLAGLKIGKNSTIHMGVRFFSPKGILIGNDTIIGFRSFLDGRASLRIGNHVDIASEVMIYNSEHNIESEDFSVREEAVEIGDYCFIGPRAIILPGVKIGKGAVVAAGAVVTKNVADFEIVGGVPAKPVGQRQNKKLAYILGRVRLFQ